MKTLSKNGNMMLMFDEEDMKHAASYWNEERIKAAKPINVYEHCHYTDLPQYEHIEPVEADLSKIPYKYGGKLFGSSPNLGTYCGSIQFCGHKRLAITAAHCVINKEEGTWYENIYFQHLYPQKNKFQVKAIGIKEAFKRGDYAYDYSLVLLDRENESGFLDFDLHALENTNTISMGYPSNYQSGLTMMTVESPIQFVDNRRRAEMWGNPFGKGSSGGAWLQNNKVIGINSTKYFEMEVVTSPMLNEEFQSLYEFMLEHI